MSDNIINLNKPFKKPADTDRMLTIVKDYGGCFEHQYLIDEEVNEVSCSKCNKKFNPMQVLVKLARKESQWMMNRSRYIDEMKRLDEKSRTKCNHCHNMTKIR